MRIRRWRRWPRCFPQGQGSTEHSRLERQYAQGYCRNSSPPLTPYSITPRLVRAGGLRLQLPKLQSEASRSLPTTPPTNSRKPPKAPRNKPPVNRMPPCKPSTIRRQISQDRQGCLARQAATARKA